MTEKLYVGTYADVQVVRLSMDFVMDFPMWPTEGPHGLSEQVGRARQAAWFGMSEAQRDAVRENQATAANGDYQAWALQASDLLTEASPGIRYACWMPSNLASLISIASAAGRTLTLAQALACTAAQAVWLDEFPGNWVQPD